MTPGGCQVGGYWFPATTVRPARANGIGRCRKLCGSKQWIRYEHYNPTMTLRSLQAPGTSSVVLFMQGQLTT